MTNTIKTSGFTHGRVKSGSLAEGTPFYFGRAKSNVAHMKIGLTECVDLSTGRKGKLNGAEDVVPVDMVAIENDASRTS